jgi:dynein heavy chain
VAVALDEKEVDGFRAYYSGLTYRAILAATQRSFAAIKRRVGSSAPTGFFYLERPFFDANVELQVPRVAMSPSLDAIQGAVNGAAKSILQASKKLRCWGQPAGAPATYHGLVAADKEVAKAVLLLAGSVERVKARVAEYTGGFGKYAFLWTQDLQAAYAAFMRGKPKLEEFEAELKRYAAIEAEIAAIPTLHNIGAFF